MAMFSPNLVPQQSEVFEEYSSDMTDEKMDEAQQFGNNRFKKIATPTFSQLSHPTIPDGFEDSLPKVDVPNCDKDDCGCSICPEYYRDKDDCGCSICLGYYRDKDDCGCSICQEYYRGKDRTCSICLEYYRDKDDCPCSICLEYFRGTDKGFSPS